MSAIQGPPFQLVEEAGAADLVLTPEFYRRPTPLLAKGLIADWPATRDWSFESFMALRRRNGAPVHTEIPDRPTEQGPSGERKRQDILPYLEGLARLAAQPQADEGLLTRARRNALVPGERFYLDWDYINTSAPPSLYLHQWDIFSEFPELLRELRPEHLWKGWRKTWQFIFFGPAHTVSGLHYDFPSNWFCQLRGSKEFILFSPRYSENMAPSKKYDWGAELGGVDITRLAQQPELLRRFEQAEGMYARLEPGDALFIPKGTWHAVVATEPSLNVSFFGLTPAEILTGGVSATVKDVLHHMRLYRWGDCTCHPASAP
jgi:lysine-specific demethylase 8